MKDNDWLAQAGYEELYTALTPKPDLWERRFFYRFSLGLLRWVGPTRITPDQITLLSLITGVAAAVLLWPGSSYASAVIAAVLLLFSNVCDALDGQLARLRGEYSRYGWLLDVLVDQVKIFMVTVIVIQQQEQAIWRWAGWLFLASFWGRVITVALIRRFERRDQLRSVQNTVSDGSVAVLYRFLARCDDWRIRLKIGFGTVGEIYILMAVGIILAATGPLLLVMGIYMAAGTVLFAALDFVRWRYLRGCLVRWESAGTQCCLFGAGTLGRAVAQRLHRQGITVSCFLDNDTTRQGSLLDGIPVRSPSRIPRGEKVIVASYARYEIERSLLQKWKIRKEDIVLW